MNTDLEALLALQADDVVIHALEERLASLEPRIRELDQRRAKRRFPVPCREVVVEDCGVPRAPEGLRGMAADIPSATGHQYGAATGV